MEDNNLEETLVIAFAESKFRWRTVEGVSRQLNIPRDKIYKKLENSEVFIRAKKLNNKGLPLFALRQKYESETPLGIKILNAITNKIH
ncbi:hypothetical protein GON26_14245 [Flavobacterium sp. GA093]|uniref:Uncharacterized protein n=1 Tax=Flavobacterium hydrocarbonoxydans TaxID=2683249 RepID=A0A6I4NWU3_9FLAO|nr:hypothetical protein [Flavobacterium hydrocarbonoxydans]MWB95527.1 hypothetical protein [Flavobacterium hydrocarbonoxydans]